MSWTGWCEKICYGFLAKLSVVLSSRSEYRRPPDLPPKAGKFYADAVMGAAGREYPSALYPRSRLSNIRASIGIDEST